VQRLFSMFPDGWPGRGLLLQRLAVGILVILDGITALMGTAGTAQHVLATLLIIAAIAGVFLLIGLWTPIAGALIAATELWIALRGTDHLRSTILLASLGIALAILGPGALSIDSLLYGRKRLDI
jgi:putative oxidoreductase